MPSKWIEHIKAFAAKNNLSYGCALSDPQCRATYTPVKKPATQKKEEKQKQKKDFVSQEEKDAFIRSKDYIYYKFKMQDLKGKNWDKEYLKIKKKREDEDRAQVALYKKKFAEMEDRIAARKK